MNSRLNSRQGHHKKNKREALVNYEPKSNCQHHLAAIDIVLKINVPHNLTKIPCHPIIQFWIDYGKLGDAKKVIRIPKSKDRQYNGKKKTGVDKALQKMWLYQTHQTPGVNSGFSGRVSSFSRFSGQVSSFSGFSGQVSSFCFTSGTHRVTWTSSEIQKSFLTPLYVYEYK